MTKTEQARCWAFRSNLLPQAAQFSSQLLGEPRAVFSSVRGIRTAVPHARDTASRFGPCRAQLS